MQNDFSYEGNEDLGEGGESSEEYELDEDDEIWDNDDDGSKESSEGADSDF